MKNSLSYLAASLVLMSASAVSASEEDQTPTVDIDLTYSSLYMEDGFKIGGNHPVFQPSIAVNTPLSGVSVAFWSSLQVDRENQQFDELDLMARYSHNFMQQTSAAFNLHGYFDYWTYPKINVVVPTQDGSNPSENMHGGKLNAGISMTRLIPLWDSFVVPSYNVYYWLYWAQNRIDQFQGGAHHELLLSYYHDLPHFIPGSVEPYAGISGSANYNDGAFGIPSGWSHSVAQFSTGIYTRSWTCSISLNRQWSYNAMVDPNNELWSMFSFTKQF